MRPHSLIGALTTVAAMLLLAPASSLANRQPSPSASCSVSLNVAPRFVAAGNSVAAYGRAVCAGGANPGRQRVNLFEHSDGVPGYRIVQGTTTDAHGFYQFLQTTVQANGSFFVRLHIGPSAREPVRVEAQVTLSGPPAGSQLLTGVHNKVAFTGTVSGANAGARVILQGQSALTGDEWRGIGTAVVEPDGDFTIPHTFSVPGDASLRALVQCKGANIPSQSNELAYEISQAQNPKLTIVASSDPIVFGQSVVISGLAAGVASRPVTLLARAVRQQGFAPVAEVTTGANGEYTFPGQSPVNGTFYEVQSGGKLASSSQKSASLGSQRSAVLYEGVKDVLDAAVSSSTVQAGQSLTFSGAIVPEQTGHVVYLERQNSSGTGFRIVQVAKIGTNSAFSITHTFYSPGRQVVRVRVPGDPKNEDAVSPLFGIQVTPALASSLTPETSGNSSLPPEGSERGGEEPEGHIGGESSN